MQQRLLLAAARRSKGWSQEEMAERVGVARNTYSQWERGKAQPYPIHVQKLAELFSKTPEELGLAAMSSEEAEEMDASRRQILVNGFGLLSMAATVPMIAMEEFLPQASSALKACWRLMGGKDINLAEEMLGTYVPSLTKLTFIPSQYQATAASLATQAKILQAVQAMHKMNSVGREMYSLEAVQCAQLSEDGGLIAAAKMTLAYTYTYVVRRPQKAIDAYLEALHALGDEVSLLRSDIYMGLASAYAQHREERQALETIDLAKDHFPDHPELDPRFLYADCTIAELHQWEGKMYLDLARQYPDRGYYQSAYDSFTESSSLRAIAERSQAETLIHYAEAAAGLGDVHHYADRLRSGALLALEVGSGKRYNEALTVFKRTPVAWQREPVIQALDNDIFQHQMPTRRIAK